ncbi:substrate-binding domain-containing protein [Streptomyces sp. S.PNR 29]|uniref:substrate-binding domain-containing protein n=1 Tax=Streptomyces sp. S.PNR 29 TaxID=2973805 RepID=UPI0025B07D09|nr:substrate-binding domain-containing protein [Streptomyces sp. S.PNR 29]MDN0198547.1 substrate-binding domain-containing protein [Streptomyces sp. S.PNR 29]
MRTTLEPTPKETEWVMHAEERHQAILHRLRQSGSIRVSDVAGELGVSSVTIRRDVETLDERGLLARVHGGAVLPETRTGTGPAPEPWRPPGGQLPRTFGMIVPDASSYYPEVIRGAREAAGRHGVRLVLGISRYDETEERAQAERLLADDVDALLLAPGGTGDTTPWYAELPVPVMLVESRQGEDSPAEYVISDHAYGARLAVRHLAGLGRRRIALAVREDTPHAAALTEGYGTGLATAGLDAPEAPRLTSDTAPGDQDGRLDAYVELAEAGALDAVLVHDDQDALLLLSRLRGRDLAVPKDLAIVAYGDEVAALADTPLTAVAPPRRAVGGAAVDLLLQRLGDPDRPPHRLSILPELHVRSSTAG